MSSLTFSGLRVTEKPPTRASPESGLSRQERIEMVVVLPAPLGPSRLKISPFPDGERDVVDGHRALGRVELLAEPLDRDRFHVVPPHPSSRQPRPV